MTSLRGTVDFRRTLSQGERYSDGKLALRALEREGGASPGVRLGISVGRRFGGAVQRNRVRRRVREIVRASYAREGAWDLVVLPQAGARAMTYDELRTSIERLLRRAGVRVEGN